MSAHEGHHHTAMGTVKANSAETLDLTTKDGSAVSFLWTPDSRVVRSEKSGERTSIGVGERAAVIYEEKDGKNRIVEVRLAATAP